MGTLRVRTLVTLRVVCKHTARYYAKRTACYESLLLRQSSPAIRRIVFYLCQHLHLCKNVGINKKEICLQIGLRFGRRPAEQRDVHSYAMTDLFFSVGVKASQMRGFYFAEREITRHMLPDSQRTKYLLCSRS